MLPLTRQERLMSHERSPIRRRRASINAQLSIKEMSMGMLVTSAAVFLARNWLRVGVVWRADW